MMAPCDEPLTPVYSKDQLVETTFTAPTSGVIFYTQGDFRFVTNKELAIEEIREQPFF